MHKRYDVPRQHIIDSLDNLVFQLYALSFFLAPSLLPFLCRLASQFISYKPREVDPKLSLRVWLLLLCASNLPSFWSHARNGASPDGRAVILDFIGMGYPPSKLHLILLDIFILCLQMVLTTISYEKSLHLSSPTTIPDVLQSTPSPATSPPSSALNGDGSEVKPNEPSFIIDLRLRHVVDRIANRTVPISGDPSHLPLPNTTASPMPIRLRAIARRREPTRQGEAQSDPTDSRIGTAEVGRRLPGSMGTEDVD
ncbi:hypothetical protein F5I97DRAFT_1855301 [Phlebopus sp. FC_14]|nr:hypothetical protein F5I97DRAFT_1855301 [Phlebopus sp. FC_14]